MLKFLCKVFGHWMVSDSDNIAGPSTCRICGHKEKGIIWERE